MRQSIAWRWLIAGLSLGMPAWAQPGVEGGAAAPEKTGAQVEMVPEGVVFSPEARAARAQVLERLGMMVKAVRGQDPEGYLSNVSRRDPRFVAEQTYWSKDLKRTPPVEFDWQPTEQDGFVLSEGHARLTLRMAWRNEQSKEKLRELVFEARFDRAPDAQPPWLFAGEEWLTLEVPDEAGGGVVVMFDEGLEELAKKTAEAFKKIRRHVEEGFELSAPEKLGGRVQQIKLYGTMQHLLGMIELSYEDNIAGWNEPHESIRLLARGLGGSARGLESVLAHEYGHVATFEMGPEASAMPWWILEGTAELAAEKFSGSSRRVNDRVGRWAQRSKDGAQLGQGLVPWEKLADFRGEARSFGGHVYTQGHHMMMYVSERFKRPARNAWLRLLAKGAKLEDATREALGVEFAKLDEDWRASIVLPEPEKPEPAKAEPEKASGGTGA
jgi:hypothetical protein